MNIFPPAAVLLTALLLAFQTSGPAGLEFPSPTDPKPRDLPGLHNVVAYHKGVLSGSVPDSRLGFATLAALGVRTVISVDGAAPDVVAARAAGLRYVHLPIGYNGFDEYRRLQLARATRDALAKGAVYIHCHHGKHRSAGAAGAVGVTLGWDGPEKMIERMKVSGTAPAYRGLYACTSGAKPAEAETLAAIDADFPEVSKPSGFVQGMVDMDTAIEHLKLIEQAGWKTPPDHPDLVPAAEAGLIADHLRDAAASPRARTAAGDFAEMLRENGVLAQELEDMLAADERDATKLSQQFRRVNDSCKSCHVKHRD